MPGHRVHDGVPNDSVSLGLVVLWINHLSQVVKSPLAPGHAELAADCTAPWTCAPDLERWRGGGAADTPCGNPTSTSTQRSCVSVDLLQATEGTSELTGQIPRGTEMPKNAERHCSLGVTTS